MDTEATPQQMRQMGLLPQAPHLAPVALRPKGTGHPLGPPTRALFNHDTSKIVHVEADSELKLFKCGVKATSEHRIIESTAFLENRKCKRCLRVLDTSN